MQEGHIMIHHTIKLLIVLFSVSSTCFSAVNSEKEKLMEELTGRSTRAVVQVLPAKLAPLPERHLSAGLSAFSGKNYILALKHFNTVILKHSKSKEVKSAYLAKAKLYSEIGLNEQAQMNSKLALQYGNNISK